MGFVRSEVGGRFLRAAGTLLTGLIPGHRGRVFGRSMRRSGAATFYLSQIVNKS